MERKNLFLAAILLVGMNCPINTNTAAEVATDVAAEGASYFGGLINPQGLSWTAIGAIGTTAALVNIVHRAIKSALHTPNEIGHVNVDPAEVKHIMVKVKLGNNTYTQRVKWDAKQAPATKAAFVAGVNQELRLANKQSAKFTYEVSLDMNEGRSILLTKPMQKSPTIVLDKSKNARDHANFAQVLWDRVIIHAFVTQDECKNGETWKTAIELSRPFLDKFNIKYTTEITQIDYTIAPAKSVATAAPLALATRYVGIPNSLFTAGIYGAAYVTSRALNKKCTKSRGLNLELPRNKEVLRFEDTLAEADHRIENYKRNQSTNRRNITFDQWNTQLQVLKAAYKTDESATNKLALKEHAKSVKDFKMTRVAKLTDKVSGLTLHYALPTENVTTGALKLKHITKASDLGLVPDGTYWNNFTTLCGVAQDGLSNVADFLNPFGDESDDEDDDFDI